MGRGEGAHFYIFSVGCSEFPLNPTLPSLRAHKPGALN